LGASQEGSAGARVEVRAGMRGVVVEEPRSGSVDGFGSTGAADDLSDKAVGHRKVLAPQ
jgi:hypothetical protein